MSAYIEKLDYPVSCEAIFDAFYQEDMAVFLDSSLKNKLGRYSIIGLSPYMILKENDGILYVNGKAEDVSLEHFLKKYLKEHKEDNPTELPMLSGGIGYFSYDYGRKFEQINTRHEKQIPVPEAMLVFYDNFIIEDMEKGEIWLAANGNLKDKKQSASELRSLILERVQNKTEGTAGRNIAQNKKEYTTTCGITEKNQIMTTSEIMQNCKQEKTADTQRITQNCKNKKTLYTKKGMNNFKKSKTTYTKKIIKNYKNKKTAYTKKIIKNYKNKKATYTKKIVKNYKNKKTTYTKKIRKIKDYIRKGHIYVMNMTRQLTIKSSRMPYSVFKNLQENNPAPFSGYMNYGDFEIISASPERFIKVDKERNIETRPIKGTRKRGSTPEEDEALRKELEDSEKDKSELLMITDLERNDLNKICVPGSVKVTELFQIETYATVFHLISNVRGHLQDDIDLTDILKALFPGGSITGAPKVRAMEIIDELEEQRRGLYTGIIGYVSLDGSCEFNIVIRSAVHEKENYHIGVGGGITYESDAAFEYEETVQKARALVHAICE